MTSKEALIRLSQTAGALALEFGDNMYETDKEALAVLKADYDMKVLLQKIIGVWSRPQLNEVGEKFEDYIGVVVKDNQLSQEQLQQIKTWLEKN